LKKAFAIEAKNFDTTYALGEAYRVQSLEGGEDFVELAAEAMKWFGLGMKLNPWDGYNFLYYGWCLDWMQRQKESGTVLFQKPRPRPEWLCYHGLYRPALRRA